MNNPDDEAFVKIPHDLMRSLEGRKKWNDEVNKKYSYSPKESKIVDFFGYLIVGIYVGIIRFIVPVCIIILTIKILSKSM
jgi:hypothetical protein